MRNLSCLVCWKPFVLRRYGLEPGIIVCSAPGIGGGGPAKLYLSRSLCPQRFLCPQASSFRQGVVVTDVEPGSHAAEAGIQPEDVILEVNRQAVKSGTDIRNAVRDSGSRPSLMLFSREGINHFFAVQAK